MAWLVLFVPLLLLVEGVGIASRSGTAYTPNDKDKARGIRLFGVLTGLIAGLGLLIEWLILAGLLVLSSEFGLVMVQGEAARFGLGALIIGVAIVVGLGLCVARLMYARTVDRKLGLVLGAIVLMIGFWSADHMFALNPNALQSVHVYAYDLWWPPMLCLLGAGLGEIILITLQVQDRLFRLFVGTVFVAILSSVAVGQAALDDPAAIDLWTGLLLISPFAGIIMAIALTLRRYGTDLFSPTQGETTHRRLWIGLALLQIAGLLIWSASLLINAGRVYLAAAASIAAITTGVLGLFGSIFRSVRIVRQTKSPFVKPQPPKTETPHRIRALALMGIAFSLAGLFYSELISPAFAVTCFVASWILLAESIAPGPLHGIVVSFRQGELFAPNSPILNLFRDANSPLVKTVSGLWKSWKSLISLSDKPVVAIVKTLIGAVIAVILVVFVSELPNVGKTVIQPFTVPSKFAEIGQAISDRVANDLNRLNQQLQPDIVIPSAIAQSFRIDPARSGANTVDTVLAQSSELAVSNVKIPLNLFVAPVREPIRELLGVNLIIGSLQADRTGYTLLANSTAGETWVVHYSIAQVYTRTLQTTSAGSPWVASRPPSQTYALDLLLTYGDGITQSLQVPLVVGGEWDARLSADSVLAATTSSSAPLNVPFTLTLQAPLTLALSGDPMIVPVSAAGPVTLTIVSGSSTQILPREGIFPFGIMLMEDVSAAGMPDPGDVIAAMSEELAFHIMSSNAQPVSAGMTRSWPAFQAFNNGLQVWQAYQTGNYDMLTQAIEYFREATRIDPAFSLAYYRLGLALQNDNQPVAAAEAFRASVAADANFTAGLNALAFHLYNFDSYYQETPAAVLSLPPVSPSVRESHQDEARRLWQQVVLSSLSASSLPDRASAYYGLCQDALNTAIDPSKVDAATSRRYFSLSYFYCRQALQLYADLSAALRSDPRVKRAEATVLNALGVTLVRSELTQEEIQVAPDKWDCAANTIARNGLSARGEINRRIQLRSRYAAKALRYYRQALELLPGDPDIRCNAASATLATGDYQLLEELSADSSARLHLAEQYARLATRSEAGYPSLQQYFSPRNPMLPLLILIAGLQAETGKPSPYYRLALNEYQAAIERDPANLAALYGYARTFWAWRLNWMQVLPPDGPEPEIAHQAEAYARQAIVLAAGKRSEPNEVLARAALGEVLLAQARPIEAIEELTKTYRLAPQHSRYDELRWDLAQAYLCAAYNDRAAGRADAYPLAQATQLLEQIRHNETTREAQLFTSRPSLFDADGHDRVCSRNQRGTPIFPIEKSPDPDGPLYKLKGGQPTYERHPVCEWLGVSGQVQADGETFTHEWQLHVWGGGIDQRIPIGEQRDQSVVLAFQPRETHDYYFAQLEIKQPDLSRNSIGKPVSETYSIPTFDNCAENQIDLTFEHIR